MIRLCGAFASTLACLTGAATALAAGSGANGEIAFSAMPLVFSGGSSYSDLFAIKPDGLGRRLIAGGPDYESAPSWAPDGDRLLFVRAGRAGGFALLTAGSDGTGESATGIGRAAAPAWSPDRTLVAWSPPSNAEVRVSKLDGTAERVVADGAITSLGPSWSPDGAQLAFTKRADPSTYVATVDLLTGAETRLVGGGGGAGPTWSPDGRRIAFGKQDGIWSVSAGGGSAVRLTTHPSDHSPTWSPDGLQIAFISSREDGNDLWVMDADGANPVNLTRTPDQAENEPDWQPIPVGGATAPSTASAKRVADDGLATSVTCDSACSVTSELLIARRDAARLRIARRRPATVVIGRASARRSRAGRLTLRVRPARRAARGLRRARRLEASLRATIVAQGRRTVIPRRVTLK